MKCPNCGAAELIHDTRDIPYTYKGESTIIPQVTGDFCPACGDVILESDEGTRTSNLMLAFNKQVNAFSRYETGKTNPPVALVKLLKVLERHPELLAEIRMI